jgi:hypothetical protein
MKLVLWYVKNRAMHDGMDDLLVWHYDRNGMFSAARGFIYLSILRIKLISLPILSNFTAIHAIN